MDERKHALLSIARLYIGHSRGDISIKLMIKNHKLHKILDTIINEKYTRDPVSGTEALSQEP